MEFDLRQLKYNNMNDEYDLEGLYEWILENVEDYSGDDLFAYYLIDDLFEGSSYNEIRLNDGRWITAYSLREEFKRNDR